MKYFGLTAAVALGLLLGGCVGGPAPRPNVASFDLGEPGGPLAFALPLGRISVDGPSWLAGTAMNYRPGAELARRQAYAESRWVAPPAEMLTVALRRRLIPAAQGGCQLHLELDEFIQRFDGGGDSQAAISVRAELRTPHDSDILARGVFNLVAPAGRDARDGVAAYGQLAGRLADDLAAWSRSEGIRGLAARCKGAP